MSTPPATTKATLAALRRGDLAGARELRLPGVTEVPGEVFALADSLELLDLGDGTLDALPPDFAKLGKLRALFISGNRFARLPAVLGDCAALSQIGARGMALREVPGEALPARLRWLTLTDNRIEHLPDALGQRPALQKLLLSGNRLRALPDGLGEAANLELIRLAANRFEDLPAWLDQLPRLAWASWAGNPWEASLPARRRVRISWSDLDMSERLGEGASGIVHRAKMTEADSSRRCVAVKMFKGSMTSDGLPEREMAASLAAGDHPNLTGGLGQVSDHPDADQGLVMRLLPAEWRPLAGPPSLSSCSRDVYASDSQLSADAAFRIARGTARATAHLHARGLSHGDLYAHNLLWDGSDGHSVLSDFGAASVLPEGERGQNFARVETRAFGILLGELIARSDLRLADRAPLQALEQACTQASPAARPLMADVAAALDAMRL